MMRAFSACCHCGAVKLSGQFDIELRKPARCTCSFCRRRQAGNISCAVTDLKVVKCQDTLRLYQSGTQTAEHYFCGTCGIYTHHRRRADPSEYGVNIGCIDGENPWDYEPMEWHEGVLHPSDAAREN